MAEVARLEINVQARTGRAITQLTALNAQLNRLQRSMTQLSGPADDLQNRFNGLSDSTNRVAGSTGNAARRTDDFNNSLRRTRGSADNASGGISNLSSMMPRLIYQFIAFGVVAVAPVLVETVALLGALTSVAGVATVSLGAFFLAAMGSSRATAAMKEFGGEFRDWQESLSDFTGPPIEHFLQTLADNLHQLNPIVKTTSAILLRGSEAFAAFLETKQFSSWLDDVNEATKTMLPGLGSAIGDLLVGLMEIIRAFIPMGNSFVSWLTDAAGRFREWAATLGDNQGFQNFSDWVYQNTPIIVDHLKTIVGGIIDLIYNMRDLGSLALGAFANVAEAVGSLSPDQITAIGIALVSMYGAVQLFSGVSAIASGFSSLSSGLALLGGTGGIVAAVVIAVAAAMFIAWQRSEAFRNLVTQKLLPAFQDMWTAFVALYDTLKPLIDLWLQWVVVVAYALVAWVAFWATVYSYAIQIVNIIIIGWREIFNATREMWNNLSSFIKVVLIGLVTIISGPLLLIIALWRTGWTNIKNFFVNIWNSIRNTAVSIWNYLKMAVTNMVTSIKTSISLGLTGIKNLWNAGWQAMKTIVTNWKNRIVDVVKAIKTGITNVFSNASNWLYNAGRDVIRGLKNGISSMASSIKDYVSGLAGDIASSFTGALDIFSPSRVFMGFGKYIVEGLTIGMDRTQGQATNQSEMLAGAVVQPFASGGPSLMATPMAATAGSSGTTFNLNFDGAIITGNPREVEDMVVNAIVQAQRKGRLRGIRTV